MTTYERRQMILRMLQENAGVKVTELARQLEVSEGTIRNDLEALDKERQLVRVRGGAVARDQNLIPGYTISARARVNMDSKRRIAQWAAGMVESGDSILLDASTTVLHMASFLKDRQNLTVVTNGLEVARLLAENPTNTVILLGGILKNDGTAVVGSLSENILKELHIQSAFVSAAGFSIEAGLMENDMQEAQLKSLMIKAAGRTIALVDTSKFGKLRLSPFAALKNIDHIVTDNEVPPQVADQLSSASIHLTICSETTVTTYPPHI
ncbi:MAG: DeoR/GlpR family DNA-binding transcription regulator, partial [Anaerolineae bacterium]|nr:DeoR/GlpR family DNA-binding transcription regulator [Anaerolineae bacterium]